jgi:hypothetical protein
LEFGFGFEGGAEFLLDLEGFDDAVLDLVDFDGVAIGFKGDGLVGDALGEEGQFGFWVDLGTK